MKSLTVFLMSRHFLEIFLGISKKDQKCTNKIIVAHDSYHNLRTADGPEYKL